MQRRIVLCCVESLIRSTKGVLKTNNNCNHGDGHFACELQLAQSQELDEVLIMVLVVNTVVLDRVYFI